MKKILLFFACLMMSFSYAQVPQGFNYQAVVRGDDGQALSNQQNITIQVQISQSNTIIYEESHNVNTDQYGLFSLFPMFVYRGKLQTHAKWKTFGSLISAAST